MAYSKIRMLSGLVVVGLSGPLLFSAPAEARGCIKGAIIGGIAGHFAGHGVAGAATGCAVGHVVSGRKDRANYDGRGSDQNYQQRRSNNNDVLDSRPDRY